MAALGAEFVATDEDEAAAASAGCPCACWCGRNILRSICCSCHARSLEHTNTPMVGRATTEAADAEEADGSEEEEDDEEAAEEEEEEARAQEAIEVAGELMRKQSRNAAAARESERVCTHTHNERTAMIRVRA